MYKFSIRGRTKKQYFRVRFDWIALELEDGDYQGGTICILEKLGNPVKVYPGYALLHPKEVAKDWTGKRISFGRALDNYVKVYTGYAHRQRLLRSRMWEAFLDVCPPPELRIVDWNEEVWENEFDDPAPLPGEIREVALEFDGKGLA